MIKQKREKPTYTFREGMPPDVYKIIIREQGKQKVSRNTTQYSMERTIYHIIKEYDRLLKKEGQA
jgi:hypothetical protein